MTRIACRSAQGQALALESRVQRPALDYLTDRFGVDFVDTITEPGVNGVLARREDPALVRERGVRSCNHARRTLDCSHG